MPAGGRNTFSSEDDNLLVEYLANFSEVEGRKGNSVYKRLTENITGQWPWSVRHPWQSWRHRYIREPDYIDRRIRIFLKRKERPETSTENQASTSRTTLEHTSGHGSPRKRKTTPVTESRKGEKRRRVEADSKPVKQNAGPVKPKFEFVSVSQISRRKNSAVHEDKGKGSSRGVIQSKKPSAQRSSTPVADESGINQLQTLPHRPSPRQASSENEEENADVLAPPKSDDYYGELFGEEPDESDDSVAREMELDPDEDGDDMEVNKLLTDPVDPDTDTDPSETETSPRPPQNAAIASASKLNSSTPRNRSHLAADSGFFESSPPEESSSDTHRPPIPPKPKTIPKLTEGAFGGARYKQPLRRKAESSSSESEPKEAPKPSWPPARAGKKSAVQLHPSDISNPSFSATRNGNRSSSNRPTQTPRKEGQVEDEKQHQSIYTKPSLSRARDKKKRKTPSDDNAIEEEEEEGEENLDTGNPYNEAEVAQPRPTSPPNSSQYDSTTEAASDDEVFDNELIEPASLPLPSSPHTPQPVHPFDKPSSRSLISGGSGGVVKQLVSDETAGSVVKALKTFLSEMNRNMEQQAGWEKQSPDMIVEKKSVFRARGSPVRNVTKKQATNGSGPDAQSHHINLKRPSLEQEDEGGFQEHAGTHLSPQETKAKSFPSARSHQTQLPPVSSLKVVESNLTSASMHSLFSATSSSPISAPHISDKGKNKATDAAISDRQPTPSDSTRASSRSKVVDFRQVARTQRRKSGVPVLGFAPAKSNRSSPSSSLEQSPLKLSVSDQSRLIEQAIQDMAEEYQFPPEYVRFVWKKMGNLDETAEVLSKLKDTAQSLYRRIGARRSSGTGVGEGTPAGMSSPLTAEKGTGGSGMQERYSSTHSSRTTEVRPANASRAPHSPRRRSGEHDIFAPTILEGPGPSPGYGYSPPKRSRAGMVASLSLQGRMKEAMEKEQKRATRARGFLSIDP